MAKLTKEEFINKYNDLIENEEVKVSLMEDITDSLAVEEGESEEVKQLRADLEKSQADYADLRERYKERFLSSEKIEEKEEEIEEPKEVEVIDIKEI